MNIMICPGCDGEIDISAAPKRFECPHCGVDVAKIRPAKPRRPFPWRTTLIVFAVLGWLSIVASLVYFFWDRIPVIAATAGTAIGGMIYIVLILAVGAVVFVIGLLWTVFPVFMYFKMDKLIAEVQKLRPRK